ncbi:MAG: Hsp70 family protein [Myxococcales bacterium]|nr:Hsp70 family protein [Myxococcales bacterium]MCB9648263.1 Hsp70 family protein [Deltaproteobacteria bacterium]
MVQLGIDFGTTRTGVAVADRGNYPVVSFTTPDGGTLDHYPTVVAEKDGTLVYGLEALEKVGRPGWSVLRSFKRLLSDPGVNLTTSVVVGRSVLQLVDLLAGFLAALRADLVAESNLPRLKKNEAFEAMVATPANAHSNQRLMTLEAFRRAGFLVHGMMNEPSAAGVEFASRFEKVLTTKREKVAVFDLGGGTFDASLVDMGADQHQVLASAGLARLGGDDLDVVLMSEALKAAGMDPRQLSLTSRDRLLEHCRALKEAMNPNTLKVLVELGHHVDQVDRTIAGLAEDATVSLAAADYYDACTPLVDAALEVMDRVLARGGAEADLEDVAAVYVVGGASSLPVVGRRLRDKYGRRVKRSQYPSGATAIGLAVALAQGIQVKERLSRSFGVFREANGGQEVAFDPIFGGDTQLPGPAAGNLVQVRTYRPVHNIGHFRFVECGWLDEAGTPSGDITPFEDLLFPFDPALQDEAVPLKQVPVQRSRGAASTVEERYEVDARGVIQVTIRDVDTGFQRRAKMRRN